MPEPRYSDGIMSFTVSTWKYFFSSGWALMALRIAIAASTCFCTSSKPSSSTWRRPMSSDAMIW